MRFVGFFRFKFRYLWNGRWENELMYEIIFISYRICYINVLVIRIFINWYINYDLYIVVVKCFFKILLVTFLDILVRYR